MNTATLPSFGDLRRRFGATAESWRAPRGESTRLVAYLQQHGFLIQTPGDALVAISSMSTEDDLAAYACREGVAVSHASDGWWLLLSPDDCLKAVSCTANPADEPIRGGAQC